MPRKTRPKKQNETLECRSKDDCCIRVDAAPRHEASKDGMGSSVANLPDLIPVFPKHACPVISSTSSNLPIVTLEDSTEVGRVSDTDSDSEVDIIRIVKPFHCRTPISISLSDEEEQSTPPQWGECERKESKGKEESRKKKKKKMELPSSRVLRSMDTKQGVEQRNGRKHRRSRFRKNLSPK